MRTLAAVVLICAAGTAFGGETAVEHWGHEHWEAHRALLKVVDGKPNFQDKIIEISHEDPGLVNDWIEFLTERGRTTEDFIKKHGKEAHGFKKLLEEYGEHVGKFHEWIRDHKEGALALARIKGGLATAIKMAAFDREIRR